MISFKNGAVVDQAAPAIEHMLWRLKQLPFDLIVTSGNDSTHKEGSKHYVDQALDLRSWSFPEGTHEGVRWVLERALNSAPVPPVPFRVLFEGDHFHCQVAKGHWWGVDGVRSEV